MQAIKGNRRELQAIADFIKNLPPHSWLDLWKQLDSIVAANMKGSWIAVGKSLDAYFSDKPNPVHVWDISEAAKEYIQRETSFYSTLTQVMFEAEFYIRQEAAKLGLDFIQDWKRQDFVKRWMIEDCSESIWLYLQEFWESQSPKKVNDRLNDLRKISTGKLTSERANILYERWDTEDSKLHRENEIERVELKPWINFCLNIFALYRNKIPSLVALDALIFQPIPEKLFNEKFAINSGKKQVYPGRGKGKKKP